MDGPRRHPASVGSLALYALLAALIPIYLLWSVPPLINCLDPFYLAASPLSYLIPHWPPLYPLYAHFLNFVSMGLFFRDSPAFSGCLEGNFNDLGLLAIWDSISWRLGRPLRLPSWPPLRSGGGCWSCCCCSRTPSTF